MKPWEIFHAPPMPPFTYSLSNLDFTNAVAVLQQMVFYGADYLYHRSLENLSSEQVETIQTYLHSVGWDGKVELNPHTKTVVDYTPYGQPQCRNLTINQINITFSLADPELNPYSAHHVSQGFSL